MDYLAFISATFLISLSGCLAPGPMTAVTVNGGKESPHSGSFVALGHGLVEFPLVLFIYYGASSYLQGDLVKQTTGIIGSLFLFYMGYSMFRTFKEPVCSVKRSFSPLLNGIVLSGLNPYFIIWWLTIGTTFILKSIKHGFSALIIFYVVHWLVDFVWLYFLSALSHKGGNFFGHRFQRAVSLICSFLLIFYAVKLLIESL
jgi:threonine/homoserine/homoserine lactone efflux protein